ncbi:hypothetical protein BD779DRAFT_1667606 [Infundibulicybe gibba]|nr:hypothetical protein BD779DRAFT_1667606 [Infundibulicybe gibba]
MSLSYPHSIPTPPFSPQDDATAPVPSELKSTVALLDSLVSFYQQERMWVYRTRAALEQAFDDLPPVPGTSSAADVSNLIASSSLPSPSAEPETRVKEEEEGPDSPPASALTESNSRWLRRKKGFKLRLDGLSPNTKRILTTHVDGANHPRCEMAAQPKERILEMFEKIMESRMESCQRVNRLVRNANRAQLHTQ